MYRTFTTCLLLLLGLTTAAQAQPNPDVEARPTVTVTDADIGPGDRVFWSAETVYLLDGIVFVEDGAELHIQAGTVVKAEDGTNLDASALVVARGGKLFAEGTATDPVIFTSVQDNLSSPDLLTYESRGLWGGIVLLGRATTNNPGDAAGDYKEIEGVNEIVAEGDTRAEYGGTDDEDSSGSLRYVSIRHTGINIGESDGNEIQGLTLGGVGRGTVLEYIESYSSDDDGVEFFGGTVDLKYFVSAFNADDAVDYDEGWRGKGQFWFVLQGLDEAGAAAEQDGAGGDEFFTPYAIPQIYNVTYVGPGADNTPASDRAEMLMFRDNAGGKYYNSIFTDFQTDQGGFAVTIEDIDNTGSRTEDSRRRFEAGDLALENNLWWGFGAGSTPGEFVNASGDYLNAITSYLVANGNQVVDPMLGGIERDTDPSGNLDPRPMLGSPAYTIDLADYPNDGFFETVTFAGAFGGANWARGWTALEAAGYFPERTGVEARPTVTVTDADIGPGDRVFWSAETVYLLDGIVFVEDGAELHIQAGTVVKAEDGTNLDASALVVARGGKLVANGTATDPVIFTSVQDNLSSPDLLTYESRGLWGGIVLLGRATTNNPGDAAGDYKEIEGVNEIVAEGDTRAEYGGTDDEDSSGSLRYVSIRHTGINIGESDGNEIQGLTLGGVGRGTVLEYIESYSSDDDGVEFFGGTVDLKYFVSAFNADDAVDYDEGWRGKGQFWFVLQGLDEAGAAAEQDGAGGDEFFTPYAIPQIYNVTYVGPGADNTPASDRAEMLMFRDNAGGKYYNSIFTDFQTDQGGFAVTIEDIDNTGSRTEDSRRRFEAGDLALENNLWWGFGAGSTPGEFVNASGDYLNAITSYLVANGNQVVDPMLGGIERDTDPSGNLDPRPNNLVVWSAAQAGYPNDGFFEAVDFIGAFGVVNWMKGWTALNDVGYLGDLQTVSYAATPNEDDPAGELPAATALAQNYPNPFNPSTTIAFTLDQAQAVRLAVYDVLGREVAVLADDQHAAGTYRVAFDAADLASGLYLYQLRTERQTITKSMLLMK